MKKTLKLMPEYQCYPLWLYDSDGTLIDNIIPESLQANKELMDALTSVQQQFDALYTADIPLRRFSRREIQRTFYSRLMACLRAAVQRRTERIRSLLCH